jgi:hypothetical protein
MDARLAAPPAHLAAVAASLDRLGHRRVGTSRGPTVQKVYAQLAELLLHLDERAAAVLAQVAEERVQLG